MSTIGSLLLVKFSSLNVHLQLLLKEVVDRSCIGTCHEGSFVDYTMEAMDMSMVRDKCDIYILPIGETFQTMTEIL